MSEVLNAVDLAFMIDGKTGPQALTLPHQLPWLRDRVTFKNRAI
jgi:hypothetical protein